MNVPSSVVGYFNAKAIEAPVADNVRRSKSDLHLLMAAMQMDPSVGLTAEMFKELNPNPTPLEALWAMQVIGHKMTRDEFDALSPEPTLNELLMAKQLQTDFALTREDVDALGPTPDQSRWAVGIIHP